MCPFASSFDEHFEILVDELTPPLYMCPFASSFDENCETLVDESVQPPLRSLASSFDENRGQLLVTKDDNSG
jgi:hypothetical protein